MSRSVRKAATVVDLSTQDGLALSESEATESNGEVPAAEGPRPMEETLEGLVVADASASWTPIEELQSHGVGSAETKRLRESGIFTIEAVLMQTRKDLALVKGLSDAKIDKIHSAARAVCRRHIFQSGVEVLERRMKLVRISTGSSEFNAVLGGGVESQAITEVFGEFRTGKTQLCLTMAVTAQLPAAPQSGGHRGGGGKVVYIDTEGTFRPERVVPIAKRFGLDPAAALDNILVARCFTSEQQTELLAFAAAKMVQERFALIIIDSLTGLFRVDYQGRGELSERQQKLGSHLSKLLKMAEEFNVAVLITNQVMAQVDGGAIFAVDPKKPIGGHVLAHASTTRVYLRKGRGETRVAKIYESPNLPEAEATFAIGADGIVDAEE